MQPLINGHEGQNAGTEHGALRSFMLEIRPHIIGILKAVNKITGTQRFLNVECPSCGKRFRVDKGT